MRIKFFVLVAVMLLVSSVAYASNMGFKITIHLGYGAANQTWFSLPYNVGYTMTSDILNDIKNPVGTVVCTRVYFWDATNDKFVYYAPGGTDYAIDPTMAYMAVVNQDVDWTIVGSHNDSAAVAINLAGGLNQNWVSVPYHWKPRTGYSATTAELFNQVTLAPPNGDNINATRIYFWDAANDKLVYYAPGGTDYAITPGMAVMFNVAEPTVGSTWHPAYY